jgi:hypothetical protein
VALAAPNMIGNLLMASRSVQFAYNAGAARIFAAGSTNIINPNVAENNSPLPQDRMGFRYNHFTNALSVVGESNLPPVPDPRNAGGVVPTTTKTYDVELYTFTAEKTFLDGWGSVEVRIPFQTTLSSDLTLSTGRTLGIEGTAPNGIIDITSTPEETLGRERNEFGNMELIFKGLMYQSPTLALSGGVSFTIPTANNTRVQVNDYIGSINLNTESVSIQRLREFDIKNETWAASPFLAALATPTERFFAQGFMQFDIPMNTSRVNYSETIPLNVSGSAFLPSGTFPSQNGGVVAVPPGVLAPPFSVSDHLREQALMHVDLGTGYWLVRDPQANWLNGLAGTFELHYTHTLNSADLVILPRDSVGIPTGAETATGQATTLLPEATPTVGNRRNHLDILDATVGTTFLLGNRATLATAFSAPLRGHDNRTYDWEFHVQLNYYFGGVGRRGTFAPTF